MYYVIKVHDFFRCVRFIGIRPDWDDEERPSFIQRFDYDDERLWPDQKLSDEYKRVSGKLSDSDIFACCAVESEQLRRQGGPEFDVYDDWKEMQDALDETEDEVLDIEKDEAYRESADRRSVICPDEPDIEDDDYNGFVDRKPVITPDEIDQPTMLLIRALASNEYERLNIGGKTLPLNDDESEEDVRRTKLYGDGNVLRVKLMSTDFAEKLVDGLDPIEDMKIVAAHLFFLYAQERHEAEQEGRKVDEDYYYAASNLFEYAAVHQIAEESDVNILPEDETMETFSSYAEALNEYIRNATVDDELLKSFEDPTEQFLKEKGFDLSTLAGLKAAQVWLEKAQPADAFVTEGPIDNAVDWHMGEARLDGMLKIVKAKIQRFIEGQNNKG